MLNVLLADDHEIVRQGLRTLLEREGFNVVAEAADGREAVRFAQNLRLDVAVLDLTMPSLNGIDAAKEIFRVSPKTRVVVLTMHMEDAYVLQALRAGVNGYVLKTKAAADLVQAINEVSRGMTYLSPAVSRTVVQAALDKTEVPTDPLTSRERQVLQLIAEGKTTKELAAVLGVTFKTAESHRSRIMEKLDIHETATLVRYAIRQGLIQP
jgi:two-component system response regulator NreC